MKPGFRVDFVGAPGVGGCRKRRTYFFKQEKLARELFEGPFRPWETDAYLSSSRFVIEHRTKEKGDTMKRKEFRELLQRAVASIRVILEERDNLLTLNETLGELNFWEVKDQCEGSISRLDGFGAVVDALDDLSGSRVEGALRVLEAFATGRLDIHVHGKRLPE